MGNLTFNKELHEYRMNGVVVPSVTQIIKESSLSNFDMVNIDILERSIQFGNAIHKGVELMTKGTLNIASVDDAIKPVLCQWMKFASDFRFNSQFQEVALYHRLGYAGTMDQVGHIEDKEVLVDIKTGSFKPADIIQVCAYGLIHSFDRLLILYLSDDKYKVIEPNRQERRSSENVFLSALTIYNFKKQKGLL